MKITTTRRELRKGASSSEALNQKWESMPDPAMGTSAPPGRGTDDDRRNSARTSAEATSRWNGPEYQALPARDFAPARVETGKKSPDLSKLPMANCRWNGDPEYQLLPSRDREPALVEVGKGIPDLSRLPSSAKLPIRAPCWKRPYIWASRSAGFPRADVKQRGCA